MVKGVCVKIEHNPNPNKTIQLSAVRWHTSHPGFPGAWCAFISREAIMKVKKLLLALLLFVPISLLASSVHPARASASSASAPTELWRTYYGSPGEENGAGIATDANGNIYVVGTGNTAWLGDGGTLPLHAYTGQTDLFVLKLNSSGAYQWHTFYGSAGADAAAGVTVDAAGNVYITGTSSQSWQGDGGTKPLHKAGGGFVLKLTGQGAYQWHTFYPFSGTGIAPDKDGNLLVAGNSGTTWNGDGNSKPLHEHSSGSDITVLKLDGQGTYQWHTFYGPSDATGIAVGGDKNIYVAGQSILNWLGKRGTVPLHAHTGDGATDFVVLALTNLGTYRWHTFYGGPGDDNAGNLALDKKSNIFVAGRSTYTWLGDANQPPIAPHGDNSDTALLKLKNTGAYQWHTFAGVGGQLAGAMGQHVAVDENGTPQVLQNWETYCFGDYCPCGDWGCVLTLFEALKYSANGTYQQKLSLRPTDDLKQVHSYAAGIATDQANNTLLLGNVSGPWAGNPIHPFGGGTDILVAKANLAEPVKPKLISPLNRAVVTKQVQLLDWNDTADTTGYRIELREGKRTGTVIADTTVTVSQFKTPKLKRGSIYFWHVQACNSVGCSIWSPSWRFQVSQ